jgi:hypothetical protein
MTMRRAIPGVVALLAAALGCSSARERLDVPKVTLTVNDSIVGPGGSITGRAVSTDRSGIIYLQIAAITSDSLFRQTLNYIGADSVDETFNLHVSDAATINSPVEVRVTVIDNQNFTIIVRDTAYVRAIQTP